MQLISHKINDSLTDAYQTVNLLAQECSTVQSAQLAQDYKQDLLKLLWHLEDAIARCPKFGDVEQQWHSNRTFQILSRMNK